MCPSNLFKRIDSSTVKLTCRKCKGSETIAFSEDQEQRWRNGALIQNVAPELTADQREVLISGTCGVCFEKMFGGDDD